MAMFRQTGKPTFFLSLSSMEYSCPELLQYLEKLHTNNICTAKQALSMEDSHKAFLVQNDPISCDRHFNHKVRKFLNFLKQKKFVW